MAESLSTEELTERLERRVCGPEGQGHSAYLFSEVNLGNRRADHISVGLWASRGHHIDGFEIKSNRADWLREFEDHQKAEPAMALCDHFWLVTNPDVLLPHELPEKWGLLLSTGRRRHLRVEKPAPKLRDEQVPIDRALLANFIRHAASLSLEAEHKIREEIKTNERHGSEQDFASLENRVELSEEANQRLHNAYDEFKRTAGFDFLRWVPEAEEMAILGAAARAVKAGPAALRRLLADVRRDEESAVRHRKNLKDIRTELEKAIDDVVA